MFNLSTKQRQSIVWLGVALTMVLLLVVLGPVLTPFVTAAILGYMLLPGVDKLTRLKLPRALAVLIVITITVLFIVGLVLLLVPILQKEIAQIRLQLPVIAVQITEEILPRLRQWLGLDLKVDAASIKDWITRNLASGGTDVAATVFAYVKSGWSATLEVVGLVFLVPVVLFYVLLDWPTIRPRVVALMPPRWMEQSQSWVSEIDMMLSQYLRGQVKVMAALAIFYCAALGIAQFDLWLPIGLLTGILVFIPYAGFAIGLVFALGAGILQFGLAKGLLLVAIIYAIGQVLESLVLTPRLVGEQIGLHPLAVIFALLAFGYLLGFVGVLLALPLAATLAVALRRLTTGYFASPFYKSK